VSLVGLPEFQLQVGAGTSDAADQCFLDAAIGAVIAYIRWNPERVTDEVLYLDGTGLPELVMPGKPVNTTVTEVRLDYQGGRGQVPNSFGTDTVLTQGVDYLLDADRGILEMYKTPASVLLGWPSYGAGPGIQWSGVSNYGMRAAYWPRIKGCVKVTRSNGYTAATCPADLRGAVIQIAAWLRANQTWGGWVQGSQSYIDASVGLVQAASETLGSVSVPALGTARQMLAPYREMVIAGGIR